MLSVNKKDYNVPEIGVDSKLANLNTQFEYRLYGLKQEDNPLILISNPFIEEIETPLLELQKFFKKNHLQLEIEVCEVKRISIGMRKDLRQHIVLCSSILQTIVYHLEERLELNNRFKIPGIPKFERKRKLKIKKQDTSELSILELTSLAGSPSV